METTSLQAVLAAYPAPVSDARLVEAHVGGGFSGARLWRLNSAAGELCLRRWPVDGPDAQRLAWIHRVIAHAAANGCSVLAVPLPTRSGARFVEHEGHLWEVAPWLPGQADAQQPPADQRLANAMQALAEFHLAVQDFDEQRAREGPAPVIWERYAFVESLLRGAWQQLIEQVRQGGVPTLDATARQTLEPIARQLPALIIELGTVRESVVRLGPALRDVWRQHVLFAGEQVTGLIDYDALRHDCQVTDLVRLLGSFALDDGTVWQKGLTAYEMQRPLLPAERALLVPLDRSAVVLACVNWLTWLYVERREFADLAAVKRQFLAAVSRLFNLNDRADPSAPQGIEGNSGARLAEGRTNRLWLPGEP